MAEHDDWFARGVAIAHRLWGERSPAQQTPAQKLAPDFSAWVTQAVFGAVWARPGLDLRSRSLCTVAVLAALGKPDQLQAHVAGALNLGITREELVEVLMHVGCYAGIPAAVSAMNAAARVLDPQP